MVGVVVSAADDGGYDYGVGGYCKYIVAASWYLFELVVVADGEPSNQLEKGYSVDGVDGIHLLPAIGYYSLKE